MCLIMMFIITICVALHSLPCVARSMLGIYMCINVHTHLYHDARIHICARCLHAYVVASMFVYKHEHTCMQRVCVLWLYVMYTYPHFSFRIGVLVFDCSVLFADRFLSFKSCVSMRLALFLLACQACLVCCARALGFELPCAVLLFYVI